MSGFDSIMDWADENIPMSDYDTFEDWQDAMRKQFDIDGRLPLDQIFDSNDWSDSHDIFDAIQSRSEEVSTPITPEITQEDIPPITTQKDIIDTVFDTFIKPADIIPDTTVLKKIGGFIKKLFRI